MDLVEVVTTAHLNPFHQLRYRTELPTAKIKLNNSKNTRSSQANKHNKRTVRHKSPGPVPNSAATREPNHKKNTHPPSTYKSVGGTKTTTASAYLLAKTTHSALLASLVNPVYLAHSSHMSVRKRQSVLTLLMGFHWFLALKLRLPKSWRWQLGMKLNFAGRSGLRVHLSEFQLKQLGDLALRAVSNFVMPRVVGSGVSCGRRGMKTGIALTPVEHDVLQLRQRALVGGSGFDGLAIVVANTIDVNIRARPKGLALHEIFQGCETRELRKDMEVN
jgi:hypothetical protein